MLDYTGGTFVKLELGFTPSPSGGGLCLLQAEEVHDAFVLLHGYTPSLDASDREEATALVTVQGLNQSVFGYPNEEAYWCDYRGRLDHGFYEVQGSQWHLNLIEYNRRTYGSRNRTVELGGKFEKPHHFFIGSKDDSAQFLAQGLRVEPFADRTYNDVRDLAMRRLDGWFERAYQNKRPADDGAISVMSFPTAGQ